MCVCVCVCVCVRERERDRERQRQRETETERQSLWEGTSFSEKIAQVIIDGVRGFTPLKSQLNGDIIHIPYNLSM